MSDSAAAIIRDRNGRVSLAMQVQTPENVVLDYQLAGPAARCSAYLVDLIIRGTLFVAATSLLRVLSNVLSGTAEGLLLMLWFVNSWGYYVICEGFFRGKSIGKHAMGLRVVQEKGYPITFWAALLRNLLRWADAFPPPFHGVAFITMLSSGRFQRLGDLAARTVVISERRIVPPRAPVILEHIDPLSKQDIGGYLPGPRVLALIEEFLGRMEFLKNRAVNNQQAVYQRGHAIAGLLARVLAQRMHYSGDTRQLDGFPMSFLARIYVTLLKRRDEEEDEQTRLRAQPQRPLDAVRAPARYR